jgi:hypothetical protein
MGVTQSWGGTPLDPNAVASPCGSIAHAIFNDTFALSPLFGSQTAVPIQESGISWPGDQGGMFKAAPDSSQTQWINPEDEHFIVWMRVAGLNNFKKLWGIIEVPLPTGQYAMTIANNYRINNWGGGRYFVLSTIGTFGGRNYLLPVEMMLVSAVCLGAIIYIAKKVQRYHQVASFQ